MLDMGFWPDVRRIVRSLPDERQNLLFSATMSQGRAAASSATRSHDPVYIEVGGRATPIESDRAGGHPGRRQPEDRAAGRLPHAPRARTRRSSSRRTKHRADRLALTPAQARHQVHGDPRQPQAGPAPGGARRLQGAAATRCWSPPTSSPAASTSRASATSSTTTCREPRGLRPPHRPHGARGRQRHRHQPAYGGRGLRAQRHRAAHRQRRSSGETWTASTTTSAASPRAGRCRAGPANSSTTAARVAP